MRLYIAGAMSGRPDFAYPAFMAAAAAWRSHGWDVLNPAERFGGRTDLPYDVYINHSMLDVICCDAVAAIPGWEQSKGATLEVLYARTVGKPVYQANHPGGSASGSLRPETGGLWPPAGQLRADSTPADGVPGFAVPDGDNGGGHSADHDAGQGGAADGVARPQGLGSGRSGLHGDLREGDETGRLTEPQEDFMASMCRRCLRPRLEHAPFALPTEWSSCEEFMA